MKPNSASAAKGERLEVKVRDGWIAQRGQNQVRYWFLVTLSWQGSQVMLS